MLNEQLSFDRMEEIYEYSNAEISPREFIQKLNPYTVTQLAENLNNHTIDLEFYDEVDLLDNDAFRKSLFAQLKPILSYFYRLKPSQLNDEIFMIGLFEDASLDQISEFKKNRLLQSFADEFQMQIQFVQEEGIRLTKRDLTDILFACYYEIENESREFFGYDKAEFAMQLQSVFLN